MRGNLAWELSTCRDFVIRPGFESQGYHVPSYVTVLK